MFNEFFFFCEEKSLDDFFAYKNIENKFEEAEEKN